MSQSEDSFIGRWSRRKKEAKRPSVAVDPARENGPELDSAGHVPGSGDGVDAVADSVANNSADNKADDISSEALAGKDASLEIANAEVNEVPTDADMVAIETLDADSDYTPFMSEGVSSELRKAALKKLFFSGKFAARDGLDDYDDDFTYFEPLGDTVTSDMKYHARRKEKNRLAKLEEEKIALEKQALEEEALKEQALDEQAESEQVEDADGANNSGPSETGRHRQPEHNPEAPASESAQPDLQEDQEIHLSSAAGNDSPKLYDAAKKQNAPQTSNARQSSAQQKSDTGNNA